MKRARESMTFPLFFRVIWSPVAGSRRYNGPSAGGWSRLLLGLCLGAGLAWLAMVPEATADQASSAPPIELALGRSDAPITVIEYFSFSCVHCARFHSDVFPALKRNYIDTGKIKFVLRDFPLNLAALSAAALTHCVRPARYFEAVDILWARWGDWINKAEAGPPLVAVLASEGFDEAVLQHCLGDKSSEDRVLNSYIVGARDHGVDRTPTFLIDGMKYVSLVSYPRFAAILDTLLV